jgi:fucose 4-O-acetylase-like acetyltransferase
LLPAAGYVFFGLTVSQLSLVSAGEGRARPALSLLGWGVLALALWLALARFAPPVSPRVSPAYAALKLGLVLLCAALLARLLAGRQLPRLLTQLGSETLFLYVSHVLILYAGHVGLAALVGRSQSLGAALAWTLGLLISTSIGALSYGPALRALRARFQRGTPRPQSPLSLG